MSRSWFINLIVTLALGVSSFPFDLSGTISGLSGEHPVLVRIYDNKGWTDKKELKVVVVSADKIIKGEARYQTQLPDGEYGLAAFEDQNRNGKLDFVFFFPTEPAAFSNGYRPAGPPDFNVFKVKLNKNRNDVNLSLK